MYPVVHGTAGADISGVRVPAHELRKLKARVCVQAWFHGLTCHTADTRNSAAMRMRWSWSTKRQVTQTDNALAQTH